MVSPETLLPQATQLLLLQLLLLVLLTSLRWCCSADTSAAATSGLDAIVLLITLMMHPASASKKHRIMSCVATWSHEDGRAPFQVFPLDLPDIRTWPVPVQQLVQGYLTQADLARLSASSLVQHRPTLDRRTRDGVVWVVGLNPGRGDCSREGRLC